MRRILAAFALAGALYAQPLDPAKLLKPPTDSWPTYNGDYTGRRYSPLTQINQSNVSTLNLAWTRRFTAGGGRGGGQVQIKATPLEVNGILYFATPDNARAVDARSGRELWHYTWETTGGLHVGNRGFGMYGDWLYFETPDCYLVSLDAKTGKMRWSHQIADVKQEYFCGPAPMVIKNHIITGVGGDSLDVPGYLEARDPETGALQWRWNTTPRPGEPGSETWPSRGSMEHGGGMTWHSGTYDPELNLYYFGTGNPNPVYAPQSRLGNNLYTCSIVALNPDTGKLAWYYQVSPHDSHDFDNVETPVLIDGEFKGQPRKMLAQAARNGYFVVLDRTNGKNLLTTPFVEGVNWSKGLDAEGRPIPNPDKEAKPDGTLVSPTEGGAANWFAPSFSPLTGLFYTHASESYGLDWKTDLSKSPEGYGGRNQTIWMQNLLQAIDYKTGKVVWSHRYPNQGGNRSGLLSTAGRLLFGGDPTSNVFAMDPANGKILWHAGLHASVSNGPITFTLDGRQYVVVGAGDSLYAFILARALSPRFAPESRRSSQIGLAGGFLPDNRLMQQTLPVFQALPSRGAAAVDVLKSGGASMQVSKRRMLGMAGAAIWLVAISTAFTALALTMIGAPVSRLVLASVVVAAILLLAIGVGVIRATLRSPGAIPPRTTEDRTMLRRFAVVGAAEVIAIMVVNGICAVTKHLELLVPLDLLIVGIHFLPLARIFRVPRYYVMGGLFALVPVLTVVLVPVHAQFGAADAWFVIPTFGCSAVAWVTSAFNLREVTKSLSGHDTGRS